MKSSFTYLCRIIRRGLAIRRSNPALFRSRFNEHLFPWRLALKPFLNPADLPGPESVQISIANACNYRCVFCWDHPSIAAKDTPYPDAIAEEYYKENTGVDRDRALLDYEAYTRLIDDLTSMGTKKIQFIGRGEPMLHPELLQCIEYAKKRGHFVTLYSNGSLLSRSKIEAFIHAGLDYLSISFNAGRRETYAQIHPTASLDNFDRIIQNLQYLNEYRRENNRSSPILSLTFVISRLNYREMEEMVGIARTVGAQTIYFNEVTVYEATKFLAITPDIREEYERNLRAAEKSAADNGIYTNVQGIFATRESLVRNRSMCFYGKYPCYIGAIFSLILADGTVNPCCEGLRNLGNITQRRFREIWNSQAYRDFRRESLLMPSHRRMVKGCRCNDCGSVLSNLYFHNAPVFMIAPWLRRRLLKAYVR